MNQQLSTRRQLELMLRLQQLADERAAGERTVVATLETELSSADRQRHADAEKLVKESAERRRNLENEYAEVKRNADLQWRDSQRQAQERREQLRRQIETSSKHLALAIERRKTESQWQAQAVFDAGKDLPGRMLADANQRLQARRAQIDGLQRDANTLMAMRRLSRLARCENASGGAERIEGRESVAPEAQLQEAINRAHQAVLELQAQRLPSLLLEGWRWVGWWLGASLLVAIVAFAAFGASLSLTLMALVGGAVLTGAFYALMLGKVRRQSLDQFSMVVGRLKESRRWEQAVRHEAETRSRQEAEAMAERKNQEMVEAEQLRDEALAELEAKQSAELAQADGELQAAMETAKLTCEMAHVTADESYPPRLDQLAQERHDKLHALNERHHQRIAQAQQTYETDWQALAERWRTGYAQVTGELSQMCDACQRYFPNWSTTDWHDWQRPEVPPPAMQFGSYRLRLSAVKQGLSKDQRLVPGQTELEIPALMTFAEQPRLVISAAGTGRAAAVSVLQSMMFRFLTALPAGKLRLTIVDPSSLGENFANFMHLADFDEQLVGGRIWTDSRQIDERLTLLSNHMEKVLQKYLRNEFDSLHEYNQHAGEVAEPYHLLVVANFPTGLSDVSIRKLLSIAATGPRCGVYTLLSIDTDVKLPAEYRLDDLFTNAVHLEWVNDSLRWNYPLFEKLPLTLDPLPPRERLTDLLHKVARESREASRVEVPFSVVAPAEDQVWSGSTAHELAAPIGRAGANELQSVRLGRGTAQHVLISGKTGSGKSTLLHALVTNLALLYSPRELEFYLIDFKKGVEFKTYATGRLPHARVIAIESEREFGVSVLERLDEELRQRGEKFRQLGVQDLSGFRAASNEAMPRILLIVDEFQELFVTDDKLAQDAALLLDRLVRQGRAFGVHVLLGSQTLAGAYSLARSSLGQMAVRIALECSETDAHLILSDNNTAARLLNRPGEAIYNDQNGLVEGNSLFQVVWLSDEGRQRYLASLRERLADFEYVEQPLVVFEGNVPADPSDNDSLVKTLQCTEAKDVAEPTIWLGSAVRIEPATHVTLRRQAGQNLVIVGQDEPLALGILATSACALAAQRRGAGFAMTVLDGTRPESSHQETWSTVTQVLGGDVRVCTPRTAKDAIAALSAEVKRRSETGDAQFPPHYLIVHDLAQFRDLRLTEDDFGFSSGSTNGKSPAVDKQFRDLLKEGPAVGVHVLIWCDSYNSLTRSLDRLALREIDYRVALQMSPGDSTSLIDSPAAGRLGEHRAILYRDDLGTQVKFRPYRAPSPEWLDWVRERLSSAATLRVAGDAVQPG